MRDNDELNDLRAKVRAYSAMAETRRLENEELRLRVAELEMQLKISEDEERYNIGYFFGLTAMRAKFFDLLLRYDIVTPRLARAVLHNDVRMSDSIYDVMISKMRAKLEPHGIEIKKITNRGWRITREHRDKAFRIYRESAWKGEDQCSLQPLP